jgi:hypothetical protein
MHQQTIEKLYALRLNAMAEAFQGQFDQPDLTALSFEERFALLVDRQHTAALNAALAQRLRRAGMRQDACLENLDLRTSRGLDRATFRRWQLADGSANTSTSFWSGQPESAKVGFVARWAIGRRATATRYFTSDCRVCSTNSPWRVCMLARPAR